MRVSVETRTYFILFFLTVFSETGTIKWRYSRIGLEIRTWKPMVVFIETGDFGGVVGLRPSTPPKIPGFNETTSGFKFLLQTNTWNHHFIVPVSLKPSRKKKMCGFPLKPPQVSSSYSKKHVKPPFLVRVSLKP